MAHDEPVRPPTCGGRVEKDEKQTLALFNGSNHVHTNCEDSRTLANFNWPNDGPHRIPTIQTKLPKDHACSLWEVSYPSKENKRESALFCLAVFPEEWRFD